MLGYLIKLLFWGLLFYFGYKAVKQVFQGNSNEPKVKGKQRKKPLDIDDSQIEDADFEEIDDDK